MKKKASIIIVSLTFISLIACVTFAIAGSSKCAKPELCYSEADSKIIVRFPEIDCSYSSHKVMAKDSNEVVTTKERCWRNDNPDSTWWTVHKYGGIWKHDVCANSYFREESDTLYYWEVESIPSQDNSVFINYEDGMIRVLSTKEYGEKIYFYTTDDKLIGESDIKLPCVEYPIPVENKYVKIDIQTSENSHYIVTYPLR